jgi:hypothetical protein
MWPAAFGSPIEGGRVDSARAVRAGSFPFVMLYLFKPVVLCRGLSRLSGYHDSGAVLNWGSGRWERRVLTFKLCIAC